MRISCSQFEALMDFYINDEISSELKKEFESHLVTCEKCRMKFETFKNIINELKESYKIFAKTPSYWSANSENQINNTISAYVDNELELEENIKVKKMIVTKPELRKKIQKIYNLKQLLKETFEKTAPKRDYSKSLLKDINESSKKYDYNKNILFTIASFFILSAIWILLLLLVIAK